MPLNIKSMIHCLEFPFSVNGLNIFVDVCVDTIDLRNYYFEMKIHTNKYVRASNGYDYQVIQGQ